MARQFGPRMTLPTQLVLRALLEDPTHEKYGLEICEAAGLPSGTIQPILARLEAAGWLISRWENGDPHRLGRPRRRYYRYTESGIEYARIALAKAHGSKAAMHILRPRPAGDAI